MSASRVTNVNWVAWRGGGLGLGLGGGQGVGWPAVVPLAVSTGYHQHHNRRHSGIHSGRPPPFLIVSRSTASGGATDVTAAAAGATAASVTHTSAATSSVVDGGVATTTTAVDLDDKYRIHGDGRRIFLTGVQALVRLPIVQRYRDAQAGLKTSGYITGYRGSPLGTLDAALWSAGNIIPANDIVFQPGLNEDLAATAVSGTQMVSCYGDTAENIDGVFSLWYGKGPGVDRSGDAIRHGNQMGSSANGGVLLCAGDDHVGKSSTTCHQSELALVDAGVPVLNPAGVAETLEYGLLGLSMSRYSGAWVGLKTTPDVMDSTSTVSTEHEDMIIHVPTPDVHTLPAGGVHARFPDDRFAQEERLLEAKLPAVAAFARANAIDRTVIIRGPRTRLGIVTTGKSYLDTRRALLNLGLTDERCQELGVALYKVGMPWPLEPEGFRNFAAGLEEVLVVEEKRAVLEPQITEQLFNLPAGERPQRVTGKRDGTGRPLLRSHLDLTSSHIAEAIVARLKASLGDDAPAKLASLGIIDNDDNGDTLSIVNDPTVDTTTTTTTTITTAVAAPAAPPVKRAPFFCAGCPHNTSTQLPEGSHGLAGIGCSTLSMWMPGSGRETFSYSQMGGEGMHWVGAAPFSAHAHMFANLGDGTYTHSGLLAVRAAVAAKTNITYKILYNDAVAMTGGQPADGGFTVGQITKQLAAEGVNTIYVVSDDLDRHANRKEYAADTRFAHRRELEMVQLELREIPGVTALVYEQTCAAEKRRRRKRGTLEDPSARVVINADVCEGCGDCGAVSNCVAIQPLETPLGRKRQINQSSCNKDFSCIEGFCPSFVTVRGGQLRRSAGRIGTLKPHDVPPCSNPLAMRAMCGGDGDGDSGSDDNNIVFGAVTCGIGGTGVVTVGAVLAMAAHIEGKYATVLDDVGMSQKNGAVYSHLRIAAQRDGEAKSVRVSVGECDLLLATDMVAAADPEAVATVGDGGALKGTRCVLNTKEQMVGAFAFNPDMVFPGNELEGILHQAVGGKEHVYAADFDALARDLLGDTIMANAMSIGYAYQLGLLPLEWDSIEGAFEVNGVAVDANIQAFRWGRKLAHDPDSVLHLACKAAEATTAAAAVTAANARQGEEQQQQMKGAEVEEKEMEKEEKEGEEREEEKSLESVITNRMRLLTEYQDEAYAAEYGKFVQRVIEAEQQQQAAAAATNTGTSSSTTTTVNTAAAAAAAAASATVCETSPLALSVARGLSRLMAYKDEYEVARLYSSGHFEREVARQFVGDYHLEFHLSPPLLAPRDPVTGRPRKITLGPYTMSLFQALAPLKRLRGGPFDIFGRTEERKMERQLIKDYRAVINSMLDKLDAEKGVSKINTQRALAAVLEYAKAAETIRGFGHVKEASVRRARRAQATAMAQFDDAVSSDSDNAGK